MNDRCPRVTTRSSAHGCESAKPGCLPQTLEFPGVLSIPGPCPGGALGRHPMAWVTRVWRGFAMFSRVTGWPGGLAQGARVARTRGRSARARGDLDMASPATTP